MTTCTDKKVSRVTSQAFVSRFIGYKPRKIVITILPGDTLCLRLHGTQQREFISIKETFETARCRRVFSEASAKRAGKRGAKRK